MTISLDAAYRHCAAITRSHYENFPVASLLLPARLRRPISVIYAFARAADDFADERDLVPEERLALLRDYGARLRALEAGETTDDPVFIALADVIHAHHLPYPLFHDLLDAFSQDVVKKRYADFAEVMDYCRRSANPIGRLLLHLDDKADATNLRQADAICSALQLINFWQDLVQDYDENDRIYLPQNEMAQFGVTEAHLRERRSDGPMQRLMQLQYQRSRELLLSGVPLVDALCGRMRLEIALTIQGGLRVLERLATQEDVFSRPRLRWSDWGTMLWRTLRPGRH